MSRELSLGDLWNCAAPDGRTFGSAMLAGLPQGAGRYLEHAVAAGTPLASAVRLQMHGEIKLKRWFPFSAEQVICWSRGWIWRAVVHTYGLQIRGSDRFIDGYGAMRWKLFGIMPIINASGRDITRSAAGRVNIESIWLPSVLCGPNVSWTGSDACHPHARFTAHNETADIDFLIDEGGRLSAVSMSRWGNPDAQDFGLKRLSRPFIGLTEVPNQRTQHRWVSFQ